jgi:hypothetical protein
VEQTTKRRGLAAAVVLMLLGAAPAAQGSPVDALAPTDLSDVAQPRVDDPISEAEFEDLKFLASQQGMTLEAAIDRYAWSDNFALAVATIREAAPEAFTGAQIVDGEGAWVAFAASAPDEAERIVEAFEKAHAAVTVEFRPDFGFTEVDLEIAIEAVHYAVFEAANVRDVTTSFDFDTRQITTVVAVEGGMTDAALDELRAAATDGLVDAGLGRILDSIAVTIVQSNLPALGGSDDNNAHIGGEGITGCTTGFVVKNAAGVRGVGTAGHCQNAQSDDGQALVFQAGHEGAQGDFQWHTGPQAEPDDFYSGDADTTEVARRDVAGVGAPAVNQSLCKNGKNGFRDCGTVIQLNVCHFDLCNLVQMDARRATGGDSGGPVYWGNTAYGFHQGWRYDPVWPFDRDLFSRADRIDNALGVNVANS